MLFVDSSVGIILSYKRNWLSLLLGKEKMTFGLKSRDLIKRHAPLMQLYIVLEALSQMKPNKCDSSGAFSEHLKHASTVIAEPLVTCLKVFVTAHLYPFLRATKISFVVRTIVPSHCHPTLVSSLKGLFC